VTLGNSLLNQSCLCRWAGILGCYGLLTSSLWAQGMFQIPHPAQSARFIEPPRSVEQHIRDAERAIADQRYSDAVVRLGDLLQRELADADELELLGQDFFLESTAGSGGKRIYRTSLLRQARDLIGSLPQEAKETYRLRYGPLAKKILSDAAPKRDWAAVGEVRRKYFHTFAGFEASLLLAHRELTLGHPLAASLLLEDIVVQSDAIAHLGPGSLLLYAATLQLAGRELPEDLFTAERLPRGQEIVLGGVRQPLPRPEELEDWIAERFGSVGTPIRDRSSDYPMFGATPNRNDFTAAEMPIANPRWMKQTLASERQERAITEISNDLISGGMLPPPSWTPLRMGDQLLMKTSDCLFGVDFRTGKLVWQYPWSDPYEKFESSDVAKDLFGETSGPGDLLSQRVWNDLPYGQITSDGERVFLIDNLGEIEYASFSPIIGMRGTRPADATTNALVCLELETEGKLLWQIGADESQATALSQAFFLGPPLPLDGLLYVMAEIAGDIQLLCLSPVTGEEIWRQHLVAVETGGIEFDVVRRVAGATPSYHQGVLLCPTGAGAFVAIDLVDRMFRWGINYPRNVEIGHSMHNRGRGPEKEQLLQRWYSGTAVAVGDTVLVTPIESDRLFAFDLVTGAEQFREMQRIQQRYLAGVQGDRFLVVGATGVSAYDLGRGGAPVWKTDPGMIPAGQQVSGRGVFGEGEYLLPTTANELIRISLDDGRVLERRSTRFPLGNLIAVNGQLISQSPTHLAVAYGERSLEPRVNAVLQENPDDLDSLIRKAEILIQRESRSEALEVLARARRVQPDDDEVLMLSVDAMLGMLRSEADVDADFMETLESLIDQPNQRIELLALRIRWALGQSKVDVAMDYFAEFSELVRHESSLKEVSAQIVNDPSRYCSLDSWLAARFDDLWTLADDDQRQQIDERLAEIFQQHAQAPSAMLTQLARHFQASTQSARIRESLANRFLDEREYLRLERTALGRRIPTTDSLAELSSAQLLNLGNAYALAGMGPDALVVAQLLSERDDPNAAEQAEVIRSLGAQFVSRSEWDHDRIDMDAEPTLKWEPLRMPTRMIPQDVTAGETKVMAGQAFRGWQVWKDFRNPVALRDSLGNLHGIPVSEMPLPRDIDKQAVISGGMMVLMMPNELIAVDLFRLLDRSGESILWRRSLSGDSGPIAKRISDPTPFGDLVFRSPMRSSVAGSTVPEFVFGPVMGDRVLLLQGGDLMAIDLLTSETLWRNSGAPQSGAIVCDGHQVAVVSPAERSLVTFDMEDGRKLAQQPWTYGKVWATTASDVLCYEPQQDNRRVTVRLVDPIANQVLLQTAKPPATQGIGEGPRTLGRIVAGQYLTLLEDSGEVTIWDLENRRSITGDQDRSLKMPAMEDLHSLHAMLLDGRLILIPARHILPAKSVDQGIVHAFQSKNHFPAHALYAVSTDDGSLLWEHELDSPWGCTANQPAETPLLMLTRSHVTRPRGASTVRTLDVLALDVRSGKVVNETLGKEIASQMNDSETLVTVQPLHDRVIVNVSGELLTYSFSETEDD